MHDQRTPRVTFDVLFGYRSLTQQNPDNPHNRYKLSVRSCRVMLDSLFEPSRFNPSIQSKEETIGFKNAA
ncbi:MAG: hypothetical protein ACPHL6_11930 [Rubripirellula sp.]